MKAKYERVCPSKRPPDKAARGESERSAERANAYWQCQDDLLNDKIRHDPRRWANLRESVVQDLLSKIQDPVVVKSEKQDSFPRSEKCVNCAAQRRPGQTKCDRCAEKARLYARARRQKLV